MAMMDHMRSLIEEYDMIPAGCTVLCAVSGGADSVCLLHWLNELRRVRPFRLAAAHFNHRLRGEESERDERFVREFVRDWCGAAQTAAFERVPPVELFVGSGEVRSEAEKSRLGLEETARRMRYAFLRETAEKIGADVIATAHTADDNLETVLLHLARGSGLRGLTGIAPRRGNLIRPLLTTTRTEVLEYLRVHAIPHVEDSTNEDESYARNRIRRQVVPVLDGLYPGLSARMAEELPGLRSDEAYLTAQAERLADQAVSSEDGSLAVSASVLGGAPAPLGARAVRILISRLNGGDQDCARVHLEQVLRLCRTEDPSARVSLPYGLSAWREYDLLVLGHWAQAAPLEERPVLPPCRLPLEDGWLLCCRTAVCPETAEEGVYHFAADTLSGGLTVRGRRPGDELVLPGRRRRTLKRILIDGKIPQHRRDAIPVLADDAGVLAAAGIGPDSRRLAKPGQAALEVRFVRRKGEEETS